MSKSFQVPFEPILIKPWAAVLESTPDAKPEPMPFLKFATYIWLDDPRAYTGPDGKQSIVRLRRWLAVVAIFEGCKQGAWLTLEDDDYQTLKSIVESPTRSFGTPAMMSCLPFSDVILNAVDKIPAVVG